MPNFTVSSAVDTFMQSADNSAARTNLGLAIGSNVQAYSTELSKLAVRGADIASASTVNLETATGEIVDVTGTTTIAAITLSEGHRRIVRFTGALTLTYNGSSLVLPGAANIITAAGDYAVFIGYASGVVRCEQYQRAAASPALPVTAASDFAADNRIIRSDGTSKGIQASGWAIDDNDQASATVDGDSENGLTVTASGTNSNAFNAYAVGGGTLGVRVVASGATSVGILSMGSEAGAVGIRAVQADVSATAFQIENNDEQKASFIFDGTADRIIHIPDAAGTLVVAPNASAAAELAKLAIRGSNIGAGSTLNLESATGELVEVTGNNGIGAITLSEGHRRIVRFTGTPVITNGSSLILPGAADIAANVGDYAVFVGYSGGVVRCQQYQLAAVAPLNITTTGRAVATAANAPAALRAIHRGSCQLTNTTSLWSTGVISGSGTSAENSYRLMLAASASTAGVAYQYAGIGGNINPFRGGTSINFASSWTLRFRAQIKLGGTGSIVSLLIGLASAPTGVNLSAKGFAVKWRGGSTAGTVELAAHNGTSETTSGTSVYAINDLETRDFELVWVGGTGLYLYVDGVIGCWLETGLPTGTGASNSNGIGVVISHTSSPAANSQFQSWPLEVTGF